MNRGLRVRSLSKIDNGKTVLVVSRDTIKGRRCSCVCVSCSTHRKDARIFCLGDLLIENIITINRSLATNAHVDNTYIITLSIGLRSAVCHKPGVRLSKRFSRERLRIAYASFDDHQTSIVRNTCHAFPIVRVSCNNASNMGAVPNRICYFVYAKFRSGRIIYSSNIVDKVFMSNETARIDNSYRYLRG